MIVYSLPTARGMGSLKHLKELFKELRIILVKGFIVELMVATRPPYPLSFRRPGRISINVIGMQKQEYSSFDVSDTRLLS